MTTCSKILEALLFTSNQLSDPSHLYYLISLPSFFAFYGQLVKLLPSNTPPDLYLANGVNVTLDYFKYGYLFEAFWKVSFVLPKSETNI